MILTASVIPSHQLLVGLCSTHGTRGIDKVGISFVANSAPLPHNAGWTDWTSTKKGRRATTTLGMRGTNLTLHARPGKPLRGALEFTPSYVIGLPDNARVPPDTTFEELVRGMLDIICELTDLLPTQPPMQEIAVTRLDLTRECHVDTNQSTIGEFLEHVRLIRPDYSKTQWTTISGMKQLDYIQSGNKRRSVRIYNKHAQSVGAARAGTVRWEARLRTKFLRSRNVTSVVDATPVALYRLRSEAWSWSGMDGPIYGPAAGLMRLKKAVRVGEISRAQAASILGNLSLEMDLPRGTRSNHRRILKSLGLPYTPELACKPASNKPSSVYMVDFRTGDITLTPYP